MRNPPVVLAQHAPGSRQHQAWVCLGGEGVTSGHLQDNVIDNMVTRKAIAAAMRGEIEAASISPDNWIEREMAVSTKLVEYGLPVFDDYHVKFASKGAISPHHRFIPGVWTLQILFPFFYNWNKVETNQRINLYHQPNEEWWRAKRDIEFIPTKAGVLSCNFSQIMQPTDLAGRPFFLNMNEQTAWARKHGGSVLMSAEQVVYLCIRSVVERQLPPWTIGSVRCRNARGSDACLFVDWNASCGFSLLYCSRSDRSRELGAIPEVFTALQG